MNYDHNIDYYSDVSYDEATSGNAGVLAMAVGGSNVIGR